MGAKDVNERIHSLSDRYRTVCSLAIILTVAGMVIGGLVAAVIGASWGTTLPSSILAGVVGFAAGVIAINVVGGLGISVLAAICWRLDGRPEEVDLDELGEDPEAEYKYDP